jgi:hypothetical protein
MFEHLIHLECGMFSTQARERGPPSALTKILKRNSYTMHTANKGILMHVRHTTGLN